jgi:hypothetical protein
VCCGGLSWKSWKSFECVVGDYRGIVGTDLSVLWVAIVEELEVI